MNQKANYAVFTILFFLIGILLLSQTDFNNNVALSLTIQIIFIFYLIKVMYGCILYIKHLYKKQKYSYSIIMNLGLVLFLFINTLRMLELLFNSFNETSIIDIYRHTLESFSYFAMLTLPLIIILSIYSIICNVVLIKKEGFSHRNLLGIALGFLALIGLFSNQIIYGLTSAIFDTREELLLKNYLDICINATLSYFYCMALSTLYCNIMAARHNPKYDKDYVIILGAQIFSDGRLTPILKGRVDRAILFAQEQKKEH